MRFPLCSRLIGPWVLILLFVGIPGRPQARAVDGADPVQAEHGMVVAAHTEASAVGVDILRKGGNAIDAAVATGFALAVTYPAAGNLGGGGFMVIRLADGTTTTIDYREKAPAAATRTMYQDEEGNVITDRSRRGHLASGVPGSVAGLLKAHAQYGVLPLKKVMAPAIRLAEKGFALPRWQAERFNAYRDEFADFESAINYFTKGDTQDDSAQRYEPGERFVQKDLAAVLKRIQRNGRDGFYTGTTADLIVGEMQRGGGLITHEDLAAYQAVERAPVTGTYRGHRILTMGPPSSGGVALLQLLHAVEPYDVQAMGWNSSATVHLMGEAMRRVYADRAQWLGDPDYVPVPVDTLIDRAYMQRRMHSFNPYRADTSRTVTHGDPYASESTETTHYSVVDVAGNAVSTTTTLNSFYGSKVAVAGAGFFLNNEMDDFSAKPGVPNQFGLVGAEANAIEPSKRMLSTMTPTIVEDENGEVMLVVGAPGGATIITTLFQVILNMVDHGMDVQDAIAAPRIHHQWLPDVLAYEPFGLQRDVVENLERRGWTVEDRGATWGRAHAITVEYGRRDLRANDAATEQFEVITAERVLLGGVDPRGFGEAAGY